jgi:hypothetical protein
VTLSIPNEKYKYRVPTQLRRGEYRVPTQLRRGEYRVPTQQRRGEYRKNKKVPMRIPMRTKRH